MSRGFTKWSFYATRSYVFRPRVSRTLKHTLYSLHFGNMCTFHNTLVQCTLKWSCVVLNIITVVCYLYKQNRSPFFTCYPVSTQFCLNYPYNPITNTLYNVHVVVHVCHSGSWNWSKIFVIPFLRIMWIPQLSSYMYAKIAKQIAFCLCVWEPNTFDNPNSDYINSYTMHWSVIIVEAVSCMEMICSFSIHVHANVSCEMHSHWWCLI